jgi:hypothetical protein
MIWSGALVVDTGISNSQVARICGDLDGEVSVFGTARWRPTAPMSSWLALLPSRRPLPSGGGDYRTAAMAAARFWASPLVTARMARSGRRPGFAHARGLAGVQLVITDASVSARPPPRSWPTPPSSAAGPLPPQCARPGPQGLCRDGGRGRPRQLGSVPRRPCHEQLRSARAGKDSRR